MCIRDSYKRGGIEIRVGCMAENNDSANGIDASEQRECESRATSDEQTQAFNIDAVEPLSQPIRIVEYDPQWAELFEVERKRICTALGSKALSIEHVGSTAVPGLAAKPRIDILLVVTN